MDCTPCEPGSYTDMTGAAKCKECPSGFYSPVSESKIKVTNKNVRPPQGSIGIHL